MYVYATSPGLWYRGIFFFCIVKGSGQRKKFCLVKSLWQGKKFWKFFRILPSNTLPLSHRQSTVSLATLRCICVMHGIMVGNVESVMCVNGITKMIIFEFGKKIEKDVYFSSFHERRTILSSCLHCCKCLFSLRQGRDDPDDRMIRK